MKLNELNTYEILEEKWVADLNSQSYLLRHKKTGARVFLLSNDDENKVFDIAFRTPPYDSTGLPHILEHSVLCGSRKYPAKDPFVELAKGSLNTFLNAMTYPDKTVYPVASCNDQDFQNLMDVYLDAVFYPNIYTRPQIFKQEGWHYEAEDVQSEITINGVVYNEMKGAFSSPDDMLDREIFNTLFPDTAYSNESGGDPDVIPELSYEDFLAFHKKYYHPSNCYIYLYGNMDMAEKLDYIDKEYLSSFDKIEIASEISLQQPFDEPIKKMKKYSITNEEPLENHTYLSLNKVIGTSLDKELYVAFQIIEYALLLAPGAVLKQALLDKGIGEDIQSTFENGIYQPYFSIISKNTNADRLDDFLSTIEDVLQEVVKNGIDRKALLAAVNFYEFRYREADFGSYPKGLMYGLQAFDSWLYDDFKPLIHIEANATYQKMRDNIESGYFEELIDKYLLHNSHASIVVVQPERGLTAKTDRELAEKLADYKASLSEQELKGLVEDSIALKAYQDEGSTKEELLTIPMLKRSDIKKEAQPFIYEVDHIDDRTFLKHDIFTNGIGYLNLVFSTESVPQELFPCLGILKSVLGFVNTENFSYIDLFNEINIHSGGISFATATYLDAKDTKMFKTTMEVKTKILYDKLPFAFRMIKEIIMTSDFSDEKRMREILGMLKSRMQSNMTSAGHSTAAIRAMSYCSQTAMIADATGGLTFYRYIEDLLAHLSERMGELNEDLKKCMNLVFRKENLLIDFIGAAEQFETVKKESLSFMPELYQGAYEKTKAVWIPEKKNEGLKTSSKVQYVAVAGNYKDAKLPYVGTLKILKVIMSYDYLWMNVRVKGGAYGCMNSFGKSGDSYFVSYRDPNLTKTLEVYKGAVEYLKNFHADERDMTKYIIGTIADLDAPMTPAIKGARSLGAYMSNESFEAVQKERDEILSATDEDIQKLSDYVEAMLDANLICVLGGEETIEAEKHLFGQVENIFKE